MSLKILSEIWTEANVSGSELLVLLALADFADDDGRNIYPSMPTLAHKARLSESQTRRIIQGLIEEGLIEIVEIGGWDGRRNRANEYRIIREDSGSSMTPPPLAPTLGGSADATTGGSSMTPPSSRPRDHGGRADATTVVSIMTPQSLLVSSFVRSDSPSVTTNERTNEHAPEPKTLDDDGERSLSLLTDDEIGLDPPKARQFAERHEYGWLERQVFAWRRQLAAGRVGDIGALIHRIEQKFGAGPLSESDRASPLYRRHHPDADAYGETPEDRRAYLGYGPDSPVLH
jgi:hypothetical protein